MFVIDIPMKKRKRCLLIMSDKHVRCKLFGAGDSLGTK